MDEQNFNYAIEKLFGQNKEKSLPYSPVNTDEQTGKIEVYSSAKNEKLDSSFVKLGDKYVTLHNYSYAMECYREALKINPHNSMAFNRMILIPPHLTEHLSKKYSGFKFITNLGCL